MRQTRVLLTGGGTGGHIFPLVAVARALKRKDAEAAFLGPEEFPLDALRAEGVRVQTIVPAGKFRRYLSLENLSDALRLPRAYLQARRFVRSWHPDIVFGKGGYGSLAPVIASSRAHLPVVLHESDVLPGLANKFLARFADHIIISFGPTRKYFPSKQTIVLGNPIRTQFAGMKKSAARKILALNTRRKLIFVVGGSQGARSLNELLERVAPELVRRYALVVSVGYKNEHLFKNVGGQKTVVIRPFLDESELAAAYTLADLVIARAGAGSIFEIAAFGKPSILIPLASAAGAHQLANARAYEKTGGTIVLEERELNEQIFSYSIESVLEREDVSSLMASRAQKFAQPDSAEKIADFLLDRARDKFWSKITRKV